ncbi:MAG: hypothetical protein KAI47_21050, partial [Deltaproteobacteria bacterium]|nr:hypothetical protein [Deltaproteobacteria bacterium]
MTLVRNRLLQALLDGLVIFIALLLAYAVRFEGSLPRFYLKQLLLLAPYVVLLRLGLYIVFGVYRLLWRYISIKDLPRIAGAIAAGTAALVLLRATFPWFLSATGLTFNESFTRIPYGVLIMEMVFSFGGAVALRLLWRILTERKARVQKLATRSSVAAKRALLIGAGSAGVMTAKEVIANPGVGFEILGFLDDDPSKRGTILQGCRVLGASADLPRLAAELNANLVIITIANVVPAT